MRVGLVLYGNLAMLSGGFLYDRMAVRYLQEQGDEVEVFPLPWRSYPMGLALNLSRGLARRLGRASVDVLLQDELAHPSLFLLNRWLKTRGAPPLVSVVHHLRCMEARAHWKNAFCRMIERKYLQTMDGFICNSNETRAVIGSLVGGGKPSVVAYPGGNRFHAIMTEEEVAARCAGVGPLRILFLGNIIPRKGLHTLVAALATLERGEWVLSVVGSDRSDNAYTRSVKKAIQRTGLGSHVSFHGAVPDNELAPLLARSHVLALPSSYEGFGIVYSEAMSFGLPVIASAEGGGKTIVKHGVNGFLLRPGDAAALTRHIGELLSDRARLSSMSLAALRDFSCHPTWSEAGGHIRRFLHTFGK
ncbi:MAG: glycosyltransferase family 4 protein [Syntrophales bacterium LBB04]|nr:glycosyltransferase family 4 protein [Syntrophales bacterium LBB04]